VEYVPRGEKEPKRISIEMIDRLFPSYFASLEIF
jgi:hypothetical protein